MVKERHGFLTFWLIIGLVTSIIGVFIFMMALDSPYEYFMTHDMVIAWLIYSLVLCLCNILILNWKMSGFVIYCISSVFILFIDNSPSTIASAIIGPILELALLQLKKNGISAWTHLRGNYDEIIVNNINNSNTSNSTGNFYTENNKSETKKCPFCAEEIKAEAIVCRFCNRDLKNISEEKRNSNIQWKCPNCNTDNFNSEYICNNCGKIYT